MQSDFEQSLDYQFNDSFVMMPINLNSHPTLTNAQRAKLPGSILHKHYGDYEDYKLTKYLHGNHSRNDSGIIVDNSKPAGQIVEIVSIDPDSLVIQQNDAFDALMKKFSEYEICFIGITGPKECGKSFFCDKIFNLAEAKGNNFCQKKHPGIFTWSTPFIKEDLCIFLIEIARCEIKSAAFRILTTIALTISASYVFINESGEKLRDEGLQEFSHAIQKTLKAFDFSRSFQHRQENQDLKSFYGQFFPKVLFNLTRVSGDQPSDSISSETPFFLETRTKYLPNAMTPSYKGKKQDLVYCSFLTKQCINPEYIKQTSQIFKALYQNAREKKYNDLTMKGNIINKVLLAVVTSLNAKKKVKIHKIYEQILKDLYISAYNLCVMGYHDQLEEFFADERAKNVDQMYSAFQKAGLNALEKFNVFNLDRNLHREFETKLEAHIEQKQSLICSINKQKTIDELNQRFRKIDLNNVDIQKANKILFDEKRQLTDGRVEVVGEKLGRILQAITLGNGGLDLKLMREIQNLKNEIDSKKKQLQLKKSKNAEKMKEVEHYRKILNQLKRDEDELLKERQRAEKRRNSLKQGTAKEDLIAERDKLFDKLQTQKERLKKLRSENEAEVLKQIEATSRAKIETLRDKQKNVEEEIVALQNSAKPDKGKK